jgi:hypothetical protein
MEVKVRVPAGIEPGMAELLVRAGEVVSQPGVTIAVAAPQ